MSMTTPTTDKTLELQKIIYTDAYRRALSAVFKVLNNPDKCVVDDTTLDKLLSTIGLQHFCSSEICNWQWFVECENVIEFIQIAPLNHNDPKIASFALNLCEYIGRIPAGFNCLRCSNVFRTLQLVCDDEGIWKCASVRNAWFLTLGALSKYPEIQNISSRMQNRVQFIGNHFQDESIFVSKSCHQFIICYIAETFTQEQTQSHFCRELLDWLIMKFNQFQLTPPVGFMALNNLRSLLHVLSEISEANGAAKLEIATRISILDVIVIIMNIKERFMIELMDYVVNLICILYCKSKSNESSTVVEKLIGVPDNLIKKGYVIAAIDLMTCLFIRFDKEFNEFEGMILRPVKETISSSKITQFKSVVTSLTKISVIFQKKGIQMLTARDVHDFMRVLISTSNAVPNILKPTLDCLQDCLQNGKENPINIKFCMHLLIDQLKDPSLDQVVVEKVYRCIEMCMSNLLSDTNMKTTDLTEVVLRGFCSMNWEVRDSTTEFIGHVYKISSGKTNWLSQWLEANEFILQIKQTLCDRESYVRVAAVSALSDAIYVCNRHHQELILKNVLKMARDDESNLVRRAAISHLNKCYVNTTNTCILTEDLIHDLICPVMKDAAVDSDWEVKMFALSFWEELMQRNINKNLTVLELLEIFVKCGLCESFVSTSKDYEPVVCEKSCFILVKLKAYMAHSIQVIENDDKVNVHVNYLAQNMNAHTFKKWLHTTDFDDILEQSQMSSDEYMKNPMSLLEDILAVTSDSNDNLLDCY
ncbi:integrator complex assembly factor BRAT1-like [Tubulanus polymorphus]|uniref:integrator complex assembly factor BRAT1-like n=1 Tax=Tubulanus polymorphus TaxID=672921 RepID=UPI003DA26FBE